MNQKADQSARTAAVLIEAARRLFASQGYAGTSTEQILAGTGLTRGALYHQFKDKAELFRAVCAALHAEIVQRIDAAVADAADPWEALLRGSETFVSYATQPDIARILIQDAPAALGWEAWAELDREHGFGSLLEGVRAAMGAGLLPGKKPEVLAVLINGALNDGVAWAARQPSPAAAAREVNAGVRQLLEGLRLQAGAGQRSTTPVTAKSRRR